jgi:HK97 family phage major capsid protein
MTKLHELKERRSRKVAEMQQLLQTAEAANRDLSDGESQAFNSVKDEVRSLDQQIERAEVVADLERRADADPVTEQPFERLEQRVSVLNALRHLMDPNRYPLEGAEREYSTEMSRRSGQQPNGVYVPFATLETRAPMLTTTSPEIVPNIHRADLYIDAFRRNLISQRLGIRILTGLTGNITIPKRGSGTSVGWVAENTPLPETGLDFDSTGLTPRHVGAITELSRQLILQSSPDVENLVREDLARAVAEAVDAAMINGGATAVEPTGILRTSGTLQGSLAGPNWNQLLAVLGTLEDNNVPGPWQWLFSPKAARVLRGTVKNAANLEYLMQEGRVGELPAMSTSFVPDADATHGTGVVGDFSQILLGVWGALDLSSNPWAETPYRKGNVLVRAISSLDIGIRDPRAFVVIDDIPVPA